jgi:hypothetical protein
MPELDEIPWKALQHAYGSAEDVPGLLRALRDPAFIAADSDEEPLWYLYGNIWHQGTVYEATSYAVPFLIDIAADASTPDRAGVLNLLGEIANGSSYCAAHESMHNEAGAEQEYEQRKNRELEWVRAAHAAVAKGFDTFVELTKDPAKEVQIAAAYVLSRLPERSQQTGKVLRAMLENETGRSQRAGLIILLGDTGDRSVENCSTLANLLNDADSLYRMASALSLAKLKPAEVPSGLSACVAELLLDDGLEESVCNENFHDVIDYDELSMSLNDQDRKRVVSSLTASVSEGNERSAQTLVNMLFPVNPQAQLTSSDLSEQQLLAVRALYQVQKGGRRIFYGHFPNWGLPDSMAHWRALAEGTFLSQDPNKPPYAHPDSPNKPLAKNQLKTGNVVINTTYGKGKILQVDRDANNHGFRVSIEFEDDGVKTVFIKDAQLHDK